MKFSFRTYSLLFIFFTLPIVAQEQEVKTNDTIHKQLPEFQMNIDMQNIGKTQSEISSKALFRPQLYPELPIQHRPMKFSLINNTPAKSNLPKNVNIGGYGHDFYNNVEQTATFSVGTSQHLTLYSAATLGVHKTLMYGNINYYNIDVGGAFSLSPTMGGNAGVFYRSNLEMPLPMAGAYLNMNYRATERLQLYGGASYRNLNLLPFNMQQELAMLNLRIRYQIADNLYINAYGGTPFYKNTGAQGMPMHPMMPQPYFGGTLEYWFNQNFGVEGGMVWEQDMFGKLRPKPKFELLFK
ncbi:MAG: hypothetical protein Q4G63_04190 [Bacteroidia bacterium]|nr:hypothetical protein [Bacteroidia bacterium]